jgi:hypothetical protein
VAVFIVSSPAQYAAALSPSVPSASPQALAAVWPAGIHA